MLTCSFKKVQVTTWGHVDRGEGFQMIHVQQWPPGLNTKCCSVLHSDHLVFETQNNSDPVPPTSAYRPGTHLLQHINDTLTQKLKTLKDSDITDTEKPPVEKVQDVSENDGADKVENKIVVETKTVTKQPKPKPPEPPKAQGPTDPPYIGDSYMSEVQPPQTVSPTSLSALWWTH